MALASTKSTPQGGTDTSDATATASDILSPKTAYVKGEKLDSFMADVDTDANFEKDTEVIENGVFYESKFRAAPYFDIRIDGIKLLDEKY